MIGKLKNYNAFNQVENLTDSTRGGEIYSLTQSYTGSAGGGIINTNVLNSPQNKWTAVSGAFTSSLLNGFAEGTTEGTLQFSLNETKTFNVYGTLICHPLQPAAISLALVKNGSVISSSISTQNMSASGMAGLPAPFKPQSIYTQARVSLSQNDYVGLQIATDGTGAVNIYNNGVRLSVFQA